MPEPTPLDIDAGGLRLRLWDHGDGEGPATLFLHGYLDNGRSFDSVVKALGGQVRAYCLDWRGHGQSDWAPGGGSYHPWDHAKDLCWVLARLRDEGVDIEAVVAHSMGGNVAMFLAGTCPEIIPRLLLIDALGPPAESQLDQPARFGRMLKSMLVSKRFGRFETFDAAVDRMLETNYKLTREAAVQMARYGVGPDPDEPSKWTFMFDPRLRGPTPFRFEEGFWQTVIGRIESPVTLLRAGHGYVPVGEVFDGRVSACSDLRVVEMPDDGHHLHVLRPDAVAAEVLGLLSKRVHAHT